MDFFAGAERLMTMNEKSWQRHAHPWSVWTQVFTPVPLLSLAIWSRVWFGEVSLLAIAVVLLWVWYNPRAFPPPRSTDNWASKGTFGERIFLARQKVQIPAHHLRAANVLSVLSALGAAIWCYGLYALDVWATVAGAIAIVLPKLWFVDRMVWLFEDMKATDPTYSSWVR